MNNLIGPKKPSTTVQNLSLLFAIYAVFFNLFWSCSALSVYSNLANYFLNNFDISSLNITGTGLSETAADGDADTDNDNQPSQEIKIRFVALYWLDLITVILGTLKIIFGLFCLKNSKRVHVLFSILCCMTAVASMGLITDHKVDEYINDGKKLWIFIIGWLSPVFFLISTVLAFFIRDGEDVGELGVAL